jgi:hypothetical protein
MKGGVSVTYKDDALNTYIDALKSYGVSELVIKLGKEAFITGFNCGQLINKNKETQQKMLDSLIYDTNIN